MFGFEESDPVVVIGRALGVSVVISALMLLTSLGFMYLFSGMSLPLSLAIILVVFAISFIAATVLLDKASNDLLAAFMGGAAVALSVTVFVIALVSGAYFFIDKMKMPGLDVLLTGFAICLIASLIINRLTLKV
ncbi:hypothetical protein [Methanocella paludicola]|nr:hypothetical protein [Methanocella paludicola]